MNPLDNLPQVRKVLYIIQWVLNGAATVLSAFFLAADKPMDRWPEWYVVALAVLPVLWTYLGITASKNTPVDSTPRGEGGYFRLLNAGTWPVTVDTSTVHGPSRDRTLSGKRRVRARRGQQGAVRRDEIVAVLTVVGVILAVFIVLFWAIPAIV